MSLAMSSTERQAFLAETRPGILSITEEGRGPLAIPIWYAYTPGGDVQIVTGGTSKKATLIRQAGCMSLCVQTETPPYKYVTVEGPTRIDEDGDTEALATEMAFRYLGEQMGAMYIEMTKDERAGSVLVSLTPQRWLSVDYTKMTEQAGA